MEDCGWQMAEERGGRRDVQVRAQETADAAPVLDIDCWQSRLAVFRVYRVDAAAILRAY